MPSFVLLEKELQSQNTVFENSQVKTLLKEPHSFFCPGITTAGRKRSPHFTTIFIASLVTKMTSWQVFRLLGTICLHSVVLSWILHKWMPFSRRKLDGHTVHCCWKTYDHMTTQECVWWWHTHGSFLVELVQSKSTSFQVRKVFESLWLKKC